MAKIVAGQKAAGGSWRPRQTPTIDVVRHRDGLRDAAEQVRGLVARLTQGMEIMRAMSPEHPNRPEGERLWQDLIIRLHVAMRSAYARWALLRIALPDDAALQLWDEEMPSEAAMQAIGIDDLLRYWRSRTDRPEWLTPQESQLITKSLWPPRYGEDSINGGIGEMYEPPPFD